MVMTTMASGWSTSVPTSCRVVSVPSGPGVRDHRPTDPHEVVVVGNQDGQLHRAGGRGGDAASVPTGELSRGLSVPDRAGSRVAVLLVACGSATPDSSGSSQLAGSEDSPGAEVTAVEEPDGESTGTESGGPAGPSEVAVQLSGYPACPSVVEP